MAYGDYQIELYLGALGGVLPAHPFHHDELEASALATLPPELRTYIAGGAGREATQRANVEAFDRWALTPRMLVGAAERDLSVELFGHRLASPLMMAPVGVLGLITPDQHGDIAAATVSARTGVPMIASTLMSDPLEDVIPHTGDVPSWFQLYTPKNRDLAASLVSRAERAGYDAIVVTLDTWVPGWRPRDLASGNFPQLRGKVLANYTSDPVFQEMCGGPDADPGTVVMTWVGTFGNPLSWEDLPWLRSLTDLPLVLKGICHPDDARRALDAGVDGIYCSNHGGRQADGGGSALGWLPGVVDAVRAVGEAPVVFDSGVRSGADMVKAIAMGATAVAVGRPYTYGLAHGGVPGAEHVLRSLLAEADLVMAVDGYRALADLTRDALVQAG